jgi:hypothetical protein
MRLSATLVVQVVLAAAAGAMLAWNYLDAVRQGGLAGAFDGIRAAAVLGGIGLILLGAAVAQAILRRPASAKLWLVLFGAYALAAFIAGYVLPPSPPA